jgi:hypothetical protein
MPSVEQSTTANEIYAAMTAHPRWVVKITLEEDARLNKMKLRSRMPDGWNSVDTFARYRAAGIKGFWDRDEMTR